jgi:hypothetical protein
MYNVTEMIAVDALSWPRTKNASSSNAITPATISTLRRLAGVHGTAATAGWSSCSFSVVDPATLPLLISMSIDRDHLCMA